MSIDADGGWIAGMWWGDPALTGSGEHGSFALPAGTVAFLLTDVENSTLAWEAEADAMAAAMARHAEIIDAAVSAHTGVCPPAQGEGDSIVAAFARASDAVLAARDAQRALVAEVWPTTQPLRVRMAVHTGEARLVDDGNYAGQAIIRAARLRAIAHGGQVLVSAAARDLTVDHMGDGVSLIDLGEHRLKDLARPEHVYQLADPAMLAEFPALRSLDAHPHNLPTQLSSFIGRIDEIATVAGLLESNRLVTISGAGGAGKTRLAQRAAAEVVDRYPDGAWWVELADVADPTMIAATVATAIGVKAVVGEHAADALAERLSSMRVLLVLDNCEHLIDGVAALVDRVLRRAPEAAVLATSREPLEVAGEVAWRIPPLRVPRTETTPMPIATLSQFESVRLFLDRARHVRANFHLSDENGPAVAGICQRLDGIPLAIELAAARCRSLSPAQILDGLADAFRLLTGGGRAALARQQTLEASINWSHALLSPAEQVVLRRLAVFRGGCTLDDAEAVVADESLAAAAVLDLLDRLVAQSLVQLDDTGNVARYWLLETVRQYGARQLDAADEVAALRTRHADHFAAFARALGPQIEGRDERHAFARLVADHDNIRATLDALAEDARWPAYAHVAEACAPFWLLVAPVEGARRITTMLDAGTISQRPVEARLRCARGKLEMYNGNVLGAFTDAQAALTIADEVGDDRIGGRAATLLATVVSFNDPQTSAAMLETATRRSEEAGDLYGEAVARNCAVFCQFIARHDMQLGWERLDLAAAVTDELGNLAESLALHGFAARAAAFQGDLVRAREEADICETTLRALGAPAGFEGDRWVQSVLVGDNITVARADTALLAGERALLDRLPEVITECRADGLLLAAFLLGVTHAVDSHARGDLLEAKHVLEGLTAGARAVGAKLGVAWALPLAADVAHALGDDDAAGFLLDELEADFGGSFLFRCRGYTSRAALSLAAGELGRAEAITHDALAVAHAQLFRPELILCIELLAAIAAANHAWAETARLHGAAEELRRTTGITLRLPSYATAYDAGVADAQKALHAQNFAAARAEGEGLDLDGAVAYAQRARGERRRPSFGWDSLTPTERRVVDLAVEGLTNPQIAARLLMSRDTVKSHLAHVFTKLSVKNRTELASVVRHNVRA